MSREHRRVPRVRWALVALALAATLLAGCSSAGTRSEGSSGATQSSSGPRTIQVRVTGDQVQPGAQRVKVKLGERVRLEVTADRADEVHLHGYDKMVDAQPGKPAVLEFQADTPGVFEVELEQAGLKLLELQVS